MTISRKQLEEAKSIAFQMGVTEGRIEQKTIMASAKQSGILEIIQAASDIAASNAKLTYSLSQIINKIG